MADLLMYRMAVDGKQLSMFGSDDMAMVGGEMHSVGNALNEELSTASHSLKNVSIIKATLLQSWNNFSVPLGVTVSCLPHNEVCDTGDRYTFTTIPNQVRFRACIASSHAEAPTDILFKNRESIRHTFCTRRGTSRTRQRNGARSMQSSIQATWRRRYWSIPKPFY